MRAFLKHNVLHKNYSEQKKWFTDRIGKTVYRKNLECTCSTCQSGEKGILIKDYDQAVYMSDISGEMGIKYYDSIDELLKDMNNDEN